MTISKDKAEFIAITALQFIAENPDRLARFFALNGLTPAQLENALTQTEILVGCLDFLCEWEPDLLAFAAYANIPPELPMQAQQVLMGRENR